MAARRACSTRTWQRPRADNTGYRPSLRLQSMPMIVAESMQVVGAGKTEGSAGGWPHEVRRHRERMAVRGSWGRRMCPVSQGEARHAQP